MKITLIILSLCFVGFVQADTDRFVIDINTKKLYVYDNDGEEIGEIEAAVVTKEFGPVPIPGKEVKGLRIEDVDVAEGLVSVSLQKYPQPVWIETMAIEIWPGNRLKCPEVTISRSEVEQSGMTIGFGEHCEPADKQETDPAEAAGKEQ